MGGKLLYQSMFIYMCIKLSMSTDFVKDFVLDCLEKFF